MEALRYLRLCTLSIMVSSIVACGGGGGGGSDPAPAEPSGTTPETPTETPETPNDDTNRRVDPTAVSKAQFDFFQAGAGMEWFFDDDTTATSAIADTSFHPDGVRMLNPTGTTIYWQPSEDGLLVNKLLLPTGNYVEGLPALTPSATLDTPLNVLSTVDTTPMTLDTVEGTGTVNVPELSADVDLPVGFVAETEIVGKETLSLAIGTFDALHARSNITATPALPIGGIDRISVVLETWTVPGIGIVKLREQNDLSPLPSEFTLTNVTGAIPASQFTAQAGVVNDIAPKTLELDGVALQSADVTITLIVNNGEENWASIGTGSEVSVEVDADGLAAGTYTAAIEIIETATSKQWTLPIVLNVE